MVAYRQVSPHQLENLQDWRGCVCGGGGLSYLSYRGGGIFAYFARYHPRHKHRTALERGTD